MFDALIWIYIANLTLLVLHEIDSAYWQEWKLFKLPGGSGFFVILHAPLVVFFLWGLLEVYQQTTAGLVISLILSLAGILAFCLHSFFLVRGKPEFKTPYSIVLLASTLIVSLFLAGITTFTLI